MAARLLAYEVSDLCLGKPPLTSLPISATVRRALAVLKSSDDTHISIWSCHNHHDSTADDCRCVGKISMVDIICYLCKEDNISSPSVALKSPVSVLLSRVPPVVKHVEPSYSLLEAIDLMIDGAQNLVVPIKKKTSKSRKQFRQLPSIAPTTHADGREFCWLTQEDVVRFLLSSIGSFSPTVAYSIESLGLITTDILTINYHSPASKAVKAILTSHANQTSVAVIDSNGVLIGEISPSTLTYCDESVAAAIATLSAGDLMSYIDCCRPPEDMVNIVATRLKERNLQGMVDEFLICSNNGSSSSSSDEETETTPSSTTIARSGKYKSSAEAVVCHPGSSLVAVMIRVIVFRVSYVWVIEEDGSVAGMVTFSGMLKVFREHIESMITYEDGK